MAVYAKSRIFSMCILLAAFASFPAHSNTKPKEHQLLNAINTSKTFLVTQLRKGNDTLTCQTIGVLPFCQFDATGNMVVKYFMLNAISDSLSDQDKASAKNDILSQRLKNKWQWGYMKGVVPDADDTVFALLMLRKLKYPINTSDLQYFYNDEFNTYRTFKTKIKAQPVSFPNAINNHGIHVEINANVFYFFRELNQHQKINYQYIVNNQLSDGSWEGYFYHDKYYATYMAMRLLCGNDQYRSIIQQGRRFLENSQQQNGSWGNPYNTALALNTLFECHVKSQKITLKAINYLISVQRKDGSWEYKKPVWQFVDDDAQPSIMYGFDRKRSLTTALVLRALMSYKAA